MTIAHRHAAWAARPDLRRLGPLGIPFLVWTVLLGLSLAQDLIGLKGDDRVLLFSVSVERSFYTWFSQLLLAWAAVLLWDTGRRIVHEDRWMGRHWMFLGVVFFMLSADEVLQFHEMMHAISSVIETSGFLTYAWVIPATIICILGFIALLPFLRHLPARVRRLMIRSAAIFVGGAVGVEAISGKIYADYGDKDGLHYRLATSVEEGMEGLGVMVFISAILLYRCGRGIAPLLRSA